MPLSGSYFRRDLLRAERGRRRSGQCYVGFSRCHNMAPGARPREGTAKIRAVGRADFRPARSHERRKYDPLSGITANRLQGWVTRTICIELVPPDTPDSSPLVSITRSSTSTSPWPSSRSKIARYSSCGRLSVMSKGTAYTPR
jgi:hypothetical protein